MPNVKRRLNQKKRSRPKKHHNQQKQKTKARQPQKKSQKRNQDGAVTQYDYDQYDVSDSDDQDRDRMTSSFLSEALPEEMFHDYVTLQEARKNGTDVTDPLMLFKFLNFVQKSRNFSVPPERRRNQIQTDALWNVFPYSYRVGKCDYFRLNDEEFDIILTPLLEMKNIDLQKVKNGGKAGTRDFMLMLQDVSLWQLKQWYSLYSTYFPASRFKLKEVMQFLDNAQFGDVLDIYPVLGRGTYIFGFGTADFDSIVNAYKTNTVDKHLKCIKTTNFDFMHDIYIDGNDYVVFDSADFALVPAEFADAPFQYFWNTALTFEHKYHSDKRLIDPLRVNHQCVIWKQVMEQLADRASVPQFAEQHVAVLYHKKYNWINKKDLLACKSREIADSLQSYSNRYDAAVTQKRTVLFNFIAHECACAAVLDQETIQWIVNFSM